MSEINDEQLWACVQQGWKRGQQIGEALDIPIADFALRYGNSLAIEMNKERRGQAAQAARAKGGGGKRSGSSGPGEVSPNTLKWKIKSGKKEGLTWGELVENEPEWVQWMLDNHKVSNADLRATLIDALGTMDNDEPADFSNNSLEGEDDLPFFCPPYFDPRWEEADGDV